jgi:hypothetical protein
LKQRIGGQVAELELEDDLPPVRDSSSSAWKQTLVTLGERHAALVETVENASSDRFLDTVPNRDHDFYHMLEGCVQHELYHAGQVALLKKAKS